ncbi:MAG: ROK family protein [Verrucomicrobiota bacterium]
MPSPSAPPTILAATAGLDGRTLQEITAPIPQSYPEILQTSQQLIKKLQQGNASRTLGIGLSVPGQIDTGCNDLILQSPNIPCMEGQRISTDLSKLTQLPTVAVSTMRALYNSEIIRGQATSYDNFVVLSYFSGMALSMSCNGNYVTGANGMAGELGHFIVDPKGELCGCGNRGCIETLATDLALSQAISRNLGRKVEVEEMLELIRKSPERFAPEIDHMLSYLAIAIGATINIFNPEAIFLYGRLLEVNDTFIVKLRKKIPDKCLKSLASKCLVKRSKSTMIQGAALAIAKQLTGELSTN